MAPFPENWRPRCVRYDLGSNGPDLTRLVASYAVVGNNQLPRVKVQFDFVESRVVAQSHRLGPVENLPKDWVVDGLAHDDGTGFNHFIYCWGEGRNRSSRFLTGYYSVGRRTGHVFVWDHGVKPPTQFALGDLQADPLISSSLAPVEGRTMRQMMRYGRVNGERPALPLELDLHFAQPHARSWAINFPLVCAGNYEYHPDHVVWVFSDGAWTQQRVDPNQALPAHYRFVFVLDR